jgi:hypothetical protein
MVARSLSKGRKCNYQSPILRDIPKNIVKGELKNLRYYGENRIGGLRSREKL